MRACCNLSYFVNFDPCQYRHVLVPIEPSLHSAEHQKRNCPYGLLSHKLWELVWFKSSSTTIITTRAFISYVEKIARDFFIPKKRTFPPIIHSVDMESCCLISFGRCLIRPQEHWKWKYSETCIKRTPCIKWTPA